MSFRQKLYVCGPCKRQEFKDIPARGPLPKFGCTGCGQEMTATFPSLARRIIEQANPPAE
jgi:hypothetical protein